MESFSSHMPIAKRLKSNHVLVQNLSAEPATEWLPGDADGQLLLDVYQDNKNIYVTSTIAGVKPEDIDIALHNDLLTIRGTRSQEQVTDRPDYFYQECYWGSFSRSIILPVEVNADGITASLKNGVLTITLPKSDRKQNISIKVRE